MPQALRLILEKALSEDASQENLDRYLPSIREIIVTLLKQLKQKQSAIRSQTPHQSSPQASTSRPQTQSTYSQNNAQPAGQSTHPRNSSVSSQQRYTPNRTQLTKPHAVRGDSGPSTEYVPYNRKNSGSSARGAEKNKLLASSASQYSAHARGKSSISHADTLTEDTVINSSSGPVSRKDPLAALQRGEALERRASRRFSAYQFAKLANSGGASKDTTATTTTAQDLTSVPSNRSSTSSFLPTKSPHSSSRAEFTSSTALVSDGDLNGQYGLIPGVPSGSLVPKIDRNSTIPRTLSSAPESSSGETEDASIMSDKITLYLQVARNVKKCIIEPSELTIPALRLLFINKFAYSNSNAFPDIYIQDPKSGIRYELDEDALSNDVQSGSLLSLNVEVVDEVKKHLDDGLSTLTKHLLDLNSKVVSNTDFISKLGESQKDLQKLYQKPPPLLNAAVSNRSGSVSTRNLTTLLPTSPGHVSGTHLSQSDSVKLAHVRKDVTAIQQMSSSAISEMRKSLSSLIQKCQVMQSATVLPPPGDSSRSFMERCFKKLSGDSDKLLTDVDDLQDIIEALRKDVAQRAVRPDVRKLESVSKDLETARKDLLAMETFIVNEKAGWKKIWERELDKICEEQQTLQLHEDIIVDLFDDLEKAAQTFGLVEQCSSEQTKLGDTPRTVRHFMLPPPVESVVHAKDAVLSEVSALQPNHERRVEAIERAEKLRKKELQIRGITTSGGDGFQNDDNDEFLKDEEKRSQEGRGSSKTGREKSHKKKEKSEKSEKKKKKKKKEDGSTRSKTTTTLAMNGKEGTGEDTLKPSTEAVLLSSKDSKSSSDTGSYIPSENGGLGSEIKAETDEEEDDDDDGEDDDEDDENGDDSDEEVGGETSTKIIQESEHKETLTNA